ncbi:MAG: hypothetical protein ACXACC_10395 [Promethearchaeota archaeon]|jgi:hypothetical protein
MIDITLNQLNKQIIIFLGLSVVNIVFAAIALAFGIVFVVNHLFPIVETGVIQSISLGYILAGGCLAVIGFWWMLPSVSIMDFITDLQFKSDEEKGRSDDEKEIGLIIRLLSYYRENDKKIKSMIFISRIGGSFFIINGILSSIDLISNVDATFVLSMYSMQIAGIVLMFGWGVVSLFIPLFLKKVAIIWEYRVDKSRETEEILQKYLETS